MAPHGCPYCLSRPPPIWSHTSLFCSTPTPATITLRIKFKVLPRPHGLLDPAWSTSPPHLSSPAAHSSPATLAFLVLISRSALLPSHAGLPDSQTHQAHYSSGPLHLSHLLHLECSSPFLSRPTSASQPDLGQKCHLLRV